MWSSVSCARYDESPIITKMQLIFTCIVRSNMLICTFVRKPSDRVGCWSIAIKKFTVAWFPWLTNREHCWEKWPKHCRVDTELIMCEATNLAEKPLIVWRVTYGYSVISNSSHTIHYVHGSICKGNRDCVRSSSREKRRWQLDSCCKNNCTISGFILKALSGFIYVFN